MNPVFLAQWMKERRSPFLVLALMGCSIIMTLLFGLDLEGRIRIGVFTEQGVDAQARGAWLERLNEGNVFEFFVQDEQKARQTVREGRADAIVKLMDQDYRIIASLQTHTAILVEEHVHSVFLRELQLQAASQLTEDADQFRERIHAHLEDPPLSVRLQGIDEEGLTSYPMGTQLLFAFTLFLAMFTIGFKVNSITLEKATGIWNRVILSPMRKTSMYMGHLVYSTIIGFAQMVIVLLLFKYIIGFHLGERFDMLLVIVFLFALTSVAFAMLFSGVVRTPEQFNMIYPSVIPVIPIIGGAYMPPGLFTNPILLTIGEFFPLTHAMDALMNIAVDDAGWADIGVSVAKMLLIGVICMGAGINLIERR